MINYLCFINQGVVEMSGTNNLMTGVIIGTLVVSGIFMYNKKRKRKPEQESVEKSIQTDANKNFEEIILEYFNTIRESYKFDRLYNYYYLSLSIEELSEEYTIDPQLHKSLFKLGVKNAEDKNMISRYLNKLILSVYKEYNDQPDNTTKFQVAETNITDYKLFFDEYYSIMGVIDALNSVKDRTDEKIKWQEYKNEIDRKLKEHFAQFSTDKTA